MSMKGVVRSCPFFITRTTPSFSATRILPSGRKVNAVGTDRPEATTSWLKPGGNVVWAPADPMKVVITAKARIAIAAARMTGPL
jgi:hypothetical protein